jgi:hypothetical protein
MAYKVELRNGYRVVQRGKTNEGAIPIDCPLCACVLSDEMDEIAIARSSCCFECEVEIADKNRSSWITGWRPTSNEVEEIKVRRLRTPHSRVHI